jgi:hypothetical protein
VFQAILQCLTRTGIADFGKQQIHLGDLENRAFTGMKIEILRVLVSFLGISLVKFISRIVSTETTLNEDNVTI